MRWIKWFDALAEEHRELYQDRLGESLEASMVCLQKGWVSLTDLLNAHAQGLDPLFTLSPFAYGGIAFIDHASELVLWALTGTADIGPMGDATSLSGTHLEEVATYAETLVAQGRPLFSGGRGAIVVADGALGHKYADTPVLTDRQLLGVGILLACSAEAAPEAIMNRSEWGAAAPLRNVIFGRLAAESGDSQDLGSFDLGSHFELLLRWSRKELNFCGSN